MNTKKQIVILFAAFYYFSIVVEKNNGIIPDGLKNIFMPLARLTATYNKLLNYAVEQVNIALSSIKFEKNVDFILVAVNIIAEYYEQMRRKKKLFFPMTYENIRTLQFECEELSEPMIVANSYEFAEILVQKILKGENNENN